MVSTAGWNARSTDFDLDTGADTVTVSVTFLVITTDSETSSTDFLLGFRTATDACSVALFVSTALSDAGSAELVLGLRAGTDIILTTLLVITAWVEAQGSDLLLARRTLTEAIYNLLVIKAEVGVELKARPGAIVCLYDIAAGDAVTTTAVVQRVRRVLSAIVIRLGIDGDRLAEDGAVTGVGQVDERVAPLILGDTFSVRLEGLEAADVAISPRLFGFEEAVAHVEGVEVLTRGGAVLEAIIKARLHDCEGMFFFFSGEAGDLGFNSHLFLFAALAGDLLSELYESSDLV